jgi:hypothetical protein
MRLKFMKYLLRNKKNILYFIFLTFFFVYLFGNFWIEFQNCPYPDFLSWDGDLRYITSLRFLRDFLNLDLISFTLKIIDSPTWPVLRNILAIPFLLLFGYEARTESYISFFTFYVLCIWIGYYFYKQFSNYFLGFIFTLLVYTFLSISTTYLLFSFSAMLEIQGSLFWLIWLNSSYKFLFKNQRSILPLFISSLLLYQTKYPYGYLALISMCGFIFLFFRKELFVIISDFILSKFRSRIQVLIYLFFILVIIFGLFFPKFFLGKSRAYVFYLIILYIFFQIFQFFQNRKSYYIYSKESKVFRILYYVLFPIVFWTLSHPDRFGSSGGTLAHVQSEGMRVGEIVEKNLDYWVFFFKIVYNDFWDLKVIGMISFIISFMQIFLVRKIDKFNTSTYILIMNIITILTITLITPNHQARHVYHLVPSLIVSNLLFFKNRINLKTLGFLGVFLLASVGLLYSNFRNPIGNLCFGGVIPIYEEPIFFKEILNLELEGNTYLINGIDPNHLNKADTEMVFEYVAFKKGFTIAQNHREYKFFKDEIPFAIVPISDCDTIQNLLKFKKLEIELVFKKRFTKGKACIEFYYIQ